jgi:hypothetical protein
MQQNVVAVIGATAPIGSPPEGVHDPGVTTIPLAVRPTTARFIAPRLAQFPAAKVVGLAVHAASL